MFKLFSLLCVVGLPVSWAPPPAPRAADSAVAARPVVISAFWVGGDVYFAAVWHRVNLRFKARHDERRSEKAAKWREAERSRAQRRKQGDQRQGAEAGGRYIQSY